MVKQYICILVMLSLHCLYFGHAINSNSKISASVTRKLDVPGAKLQVMIEFEAMQSVYHQHRLRNFETKLEGYSALIDGLKGFSSSSQGDAKQFLSSKTTIGYRAFWITNRIFVDEIDRETVEYLASLPTVLKIREQYKVGIEPVTFGETVLSTAPLVNSWGISTTKADEVHALGFTGEGVVIGMIDTGVFVDNSSLNANYLNNGHSWYDPVSGSSDPYDDSGHGTHVMGTMVGNTGFGMAPDSRWIACRGSAFFEDPADSENALLSCGEFMACPHGPSSPDVCDVSKKPHIVNNSWTAGHNFGFYDAIIQAWLALDIVPVFGNGNRGNVGCAGYTDLPGTGYPAEHLNVISVGSTVSNDSLSSFSSPGPTRRGAMKPDISAPGSDVWSASHLDPSGYRLSSGTSMASPHVAGGVALLLSKDPSLNIEQIKALLYQNTEQELGEGFGECDGVEDNVFPNYSFGWGRLDVLGSIQAIQ